MTATCTSSKAPPAATCLRPAADRGPAGGFTLLELMVTLAVIGLALGVMFTGSKTLLPQTRLRASADLIAKTLENARGFAVLRNEAFEFCYDLEERQVSAWVPYATDEEGRAIGAGRTYRILPLDLEQDTAIAEVRLPGGQRREKGQVILEISPMGRVPPHEIVVANPEYPETERMTVRINGLSNRAQVLPGDVVMEQVADVDFR